MIRIFFKFIFNLNRKILFKKIYSFDKFLNYIKKLKLNSSILSMYN